MNRALLFCLVVFSSVPALALKAASDDDKAAIRAQIIAANQIDSEIRAVETQIDQSGFAKGTAEYRRLDRVLQQTKDRQRMAYTKAIHMTILAYDLPSGWSGTSVMPATKDRLIFWIPVAHEQQDREVEDAHGHKKPIPQFRDKVSGREYVDGVAYIDPSTFREYSVGWLASTLMHEFTHFQQITSPGRGDTMSTAELEMEAYQAEIINEQFFFDSSIKQERDEIATIETWHAEKEAVVNKEREERKGLGGLVRRILPRPEPPDVFDSRVHTDAELEALKKEAEKFSAEASRESLKRSEEIHRVRESEDRYFDDALRVTLRDIALRACADPESIEIAELTGLPAPRSARAVQVVPDGIPGTCGAVVYSYLATHNDQYQAPSLPSIKALVRRYTPAPLPLRPAPAEEDPAVVREREQRKLAESLDASVRFAQWFLRAACQGDGTLSDERLGQFQAAVIHVNRDGQAVGYDRSTIALGLGQCELDLLDQFHRHFGDFNYMRDVRAAVMSFWQRQNSRRRNRDDDDNHREPRKRCGQDGSDPSWCT